MAAATPRPTTASAAIKHPTAIQILVVANERTISPARYVEEYLQPRPLGFEEVKKALSHVSYHFRALEKAGCLEIVENIPRRGAVEHVYTGTARAFFSNEDWAAMSPPERRRIGTVLLQGLIARTEAAIITDGFAAREDTCLAWTAAKLDDRGWAEMTTAIAASFAELERIREESEARLEKSDEAPIPATFGLLGFESPPSGDRPASA